MWFKKKFPLICLILLLIISIFLSLYVYKLRDNFIKLNREMDSLNNSNQALIHHIIENYALNHNAELIIELRDFVYRKTIVGRGDFDNQNPISHFISLDNGESKMLCGGMAMSYVWLLRQYGIPARTVQLASKKFVEGGRRNDTHVSVEVFDVNLDKWIISDPTFNISFQCDAVGPLLDFSELHQCNAKGGKVSPVKNGHTYLEGRRISDYYIPYSDLLFGIRAAEIDSLKEPLEIPYAGWLEQALSLYSQNN